MIKTIICAKAVIALALLSLLAVTNSVAQVVPVPPLLDHLGNSAVDTGRIILEPHEITQLRGKGYSAALVWHGSSHWVNALTAGAKKTFAELDIKVVAETDAQYDPAKQASDIENVMALKPNIILSLVIDSASAKNTYRAAVQQGAKLVLLSNPIDGFQPQRDYVGLVTDDMQGMGIAAAEMIRDAVGGKGKVGVIYHDADYFITNRRDQAFLATIKNKRNGTGQVQIAVERGFTKESETSSIAAAMVLQNPDLKAIYVAWDTAAEGVIEALRSMGRNDIHVVTHDLGVNNLLDMAMGGSMFASISDRPYEIGQAMARLGAYGLLNKSAPPFTVVGFDTVTKNNIRTMWTSAYRTDLPKILARVIAQ